MRDDIRRIKFENRRDTEIIIWFIDCKKSAHLRRNMETEMKHIHIKIAPELYEKLIHKLPEKRLISIVLRQLIREYVNGNRPLLFEDLKENKNVKS